MIGGKKKCIGLIFGGISNENADFVLRHGCGHAFLHRNLVLRGVCAGVHPGQGQKVFLNFAN